MRAAEEIAIEALGSVAKILQGCTPTQQPSAETVQLFLGLYSALSVEAPPAVLEEIRQLSGALKGLGLKRALVPSDR